MSNELLEMSVKQGKFNLKRYPVLKNDLLRAWDAADEYILNYLSENEARESLSILVVNDSFGALTIPLSESNKVTLWSDSYLSEQGVLENFKRNSVTREHYEFINSTENPKSDFGMVIMKIPKSHAYLEDQLYRLLPVLNEKTIFIAAGMVKNIHSSTLDYFQKIIGETKTSLAVKKSRLVFCETKKIDTTKKSTYPKKYLLENTGFEITNHSNVFSREKLDIGTRFFLEQIPVNEKYKKILDLGSGNGLVGLIAAQKNPQANIIFTDESYMAIKSAKENMQASGLSNITEFYLMDALSDIKDGSIDLILNNPPFHQQHATGDAIALRMFLGAEKALKKGGELWVIGNRHLGYHLKLKKIFKNCETIASNAKFVIYKATKS